MTILICIGSACHVRGSYEVLKQFKALIAQHQLQDKCVIKGAFCLGHCSEGGVTIKIDDQLVTGVTPESAAEIFDRYVLHQ